MKRLWTSAVVVLALAAAAPAQTVNLDLFAANLQKELKGKCVGYGFAIWKDGKVARTGAGGFARVPSDAPKAAFLPQTRVGIASTTKFITAITTLRELELRPGVGLDSPIYKYLPATWTVHPSVKDPRNPVTFRQLLAHRSGLAKVGDSSSVPGKINDVLKATLKAGVQDPQKKFNYENVNYALCRVLLAYVVDGPTMKLLEGNVLTHEKATAQRFIGLCRKHVFVPSGLSAKIAPRVWDVTPTNPETLFYDFANPVKGAKKSDGTLTVGAGGWWLNAGELAAVCSALEGGKLLSATTRAVMRKESLGCFGVAGKYGTYYWHNGQGGGNKTSHTDFMMFPKGVQVGLALNSVNNKVNTYGDAAYKAMLKKAYEDACTPALKLP